MRHTVKTRLRTTTLILGVLAGTLACAPGYKGFRGKAKAWGMSPLDLQACFPDLERSYAGDARLDAMWVAVTDTYPRLRECAAAHRVRSGPFDDRVRIVLQVTADRSVEVTLSTTVEDAAYRRCVDEALDLVRLPPSSAGAGARFEGTFDTEQGGAEDLRMDASVLGVIVGVIRGELIGACECFGAYRDSVPKSVLVSMRFEAGRVQAVDVRGPKAPSDPEIAACLVRYVEGLRFRDFEAGIKSTYRFTFENSRAESVDRLLARAHLAHNRGELPAAEEAYRAVLRLEPERQRVSIDLARALLDAGRSKEAAGVLDGVRSAQDDASALRCSWGYQRSRSFRQLGQGDQALALASQTVAACEEDADLRLLLARLLLDKGDADAASDAAEAARRLEPDLAAAARTHARALIAAGDHDAAERALSDAERLDPSDGQVDLVRAALCMATKRYKRALAAYDAAAEKGMESADLHWNRGVALQRLRKRKAARVAFCRAAALDSSLQAPGPCP